MNNDSIYQKIWEFLISFVKLYLFCLPLFYLFLNANIIIYEVILIQIVKFQGDIFSGLNDGILSRAEALADIGKHQSSHAQMTSQLKHDVMYHHSMGGPPQRPLQVSD